MPGRSEAAAAAGEAAGGRREGDLVGVEVAVDARYLRRRGVGMHRYLEDAIDLLRAAGARVTLLVNFPSEPYRDRYPDVAWRSFGSRRTIVWDQLDLPRLLRRERFALYWAPTNVGVPLWPVPSTWIVSTTHDVVQLRLPRLYLSRPLYALPYLLWTASAMLRSDAVLTVSQASAADIRHFFRRRAVPVAPCLRPLAIDGDGGELPAGLAGRRYVVYHGGLDPRKNVDRLLAAFERCAARDPDLVLALVGDGYGYLWPRIEALRISERVVLTGYLEEASRDAVLAAASAVVYPSLCEGFGLPVLEAFAAGVPVVVSRTPALAEVAGDAAVLVDPLETESIASGILATQDPRRAEELREAGRRRLAAYSPEASRAALLRELARGVMALGGGTGQQPPAGAAAARNGDPFAG